MHFHKFQHNVWHNYDVNFVAGENAGKAKSIGPVEISGISQLMRWIWAIEKNENYLPFLIKNQLFCTKISHIPSTGSRLAKNGDVATQLTGHNTIHERAIRNSRSFWCIMWRFFAYKSPVVKLHERIFTSNTTYYDLFDYLCTQKLIRRRHVLLCTTCHSFVSGAFSFSFLKDNNRKVPISMPT